MNKCPKCQTYMSWHMGYNHGLPCSWWACPKCGYNTQTDMVVKYSDKTEMSDIYDFGKEENYANTYNTGRSS